MSNKKSIKLNAPLRGHAKGTVLRIEVDKDGTPTDRYWRDRLKDAKTDNCVEFVSGTNSKPKATADKANTDEGGKK